MKIKPSAEERIKKRIKERKSFVNEALTRFEDSSYRLTQPRRDLIELVLKQERSFSAPQLVERMADLDKCDPVTIYRTLPILEELGIIEKCAFSENIAFYEVAIDHTDHHHHHIVCKKCKTIDPLDFCIIEAQEQVLQKLGYTNLSHRLEFAGLCPKCSA